MELNTMTRYAILTGLSTLACYTLANAVSNDGDSLSDVWELAYGFSITDDGTLFPEQTESADPDGDGASNKEEESAGTDPLDNTTYQIGSGIEPGLLSGATTQVTTVLPIYWWGIRGKYYLISVKSDLLAPAWQDALAVDGSILAFTGNGAEIAYNIDLEANFQGSDKGFARITPYDLFTFNTTLTDWEFLHFTEEQTVSGGNDSDGDSINDNEDAAPFDASVGRLSVAITFPIQGSTVQ